MCHGLASSHRSFDLDPAVSVARHLAARGYDVFALDLRGAGDSRPASAGVARRWAFDDYLKSDVPAVLDHVANLTGERQVHWVGHSMGGLLGAAHLACGGSRDFASAVLVGSSLDYSSGTGFSRLLPLTLVIDALPFVPVRALARASAPLAGRVSSPFEQFNVWRPNVEPHHWRRVCETVFHDVSPGVMQQLATALEPGGLSSLDGKVRYKAGLKDVTAPVLCIAGDRDPQCPPAAARSTFEALGEASRRELWVMGSDAVGGTHYGHFDLLIGKRARDEVYPVLERFLGEHDGA